MFVGLIFALFGQVRGSAMRAYHRGGTSQQQTKIVSAEKVTIQTFYRFDVLGEERARDGGGLCLRIYFQRNLILENFRPMQMLVSMDFQKFIRIGATNNPFQQHGV